MRNCRVHIGPGDSIDLSVDCQHISRITHLEVRDLILQALVFGGKPLRDEVHKWLNDGKVEQIAEVIAPEKSA
jgi:hypothetical protein